MVNKTDKQKIFDLLTQFELTTLQLEEKLDLSIDIIRTNVWRLRQENKIKEIGKDGKFKIYTAIKKEDQFILLKQLYEIMSNKMDFLEIPDNNDIELIKKVKEVIA